PGQEAENGEGVGLLRRRRQAELVDGAQPGRPEPAGEGGHEDRVVGTAAGGDHLCHAVAATFGGGDLGGVGGERGHEVVGGEVPPEFVQRRFREAVVVTLLAGGLGRRLRQVPVVEEQRQQ